MSERNETPATAGELLNDDLEPTDTEATGVAGGDTKNPPAAPSKPAPYVKYDLQQAFIS